MRHIILFLFCIFDSNYLIYPLVVDGLDGSDYFDMHTYTCMHALRIKLLPCSLRICFCVLFYFILFYFISCMFTDLQRFNFDYIV